MPVSQPTPILGVRNIDDLNKTLNYILKDIYDKLDTIFSYNGKIFQPSTVDVTGTTKATFTNTGLHIQSLDANYDLILTPNESLTADHTLNIILGDADRTLTLPNPTFTDVIVSNLTASKPVFTNTSKQLVSTGTLAYDQGGTGLSTIAAGSVLGANVLNTYLAINSIAGLKLLQNNAGTISWETVTGTGSPVMGTAPTISNPVITNLNPGADFTLTQNSVAAFKSENTGAVANTLYLKTGYVGIGVIPTEQLNIYKSGGTCAAVITTEADSNTSILRFRRAKAGPALVTTGQDVLTITGQGYDGTAYEEVGKILFEVDGVAAENDMPGRITFFTTPSGSVTVAERMRITQAGNVGINDVAPAEKLDVNGNINVTGVYKIDDVQVLGSQGAHIINADGSLADITTKFNTLLSTLETIGILASA